MGRYVSVLRKNESQGKDKEISCREHVYNLFNVAHTRGYRLYWPAPCISPDQTASSQGSTISEAIFIESGVKDKGFLKFSTEPPLN